MNLSITCYVHAGVASMFFLFQIYELRVMETKPDKAVSIIECDMNVRPYIYLLLHCNSMINAHTPKSTLWHHDYFSAVTLIVVQVDFDAPLGYKEPERRPQHHEEPAVWNQGVVSSALVFYTVPLLKHYMTNATCCLAGGGKGHQQLCWHGHEVQGKYTEVCDVLSNMYFHEYNYQ